MACQEDEKEKQTEPQEGVTLLAQEQLENVTGTGKGLNCMFACFGGKIETVVNSPRYARAESIPRANAQPVRPNPAPPPPAPSGGQGQPSCWDRIRGRAAQWVGFVYS